MKYLIVGDVHGCLHTLKAFLETYWDSDNEHLILVGDIIDRGHYTPQLVEYCKNLVEDLQHNVTVLLGNHEYELICHMEDGPNNNWLDQCGYQTLNQYEASDIDMVSHYRWFKDLPLFFETNFMKISHAGIHSDSKNILNLDHMTSLIWNRAGIVNIGKLQVYGHTPQEDSPQFQASSKSINIDTGAAYGGQLSGVKIDSQGHIVDVLSLDVLKTDIL